MVNRKTTAGKKGTSKLKLKKETIKDLDVKGKAGNVKGGGADCPTTRNHLIH